MNNMIKKLEEVDEILASFEDWMHGDNGRMCTIARRLLKEAIDVLDSPPDNIKVQYEIICNEYVRKFSDKQDLEFDGWVGDEVGGIASFSSQYFFNISDIVFDLNTNQPVGLILHWQEDGTDYNIQREKTEYINYKSYTMGLRYEDLK